MKIKSQRMATILKNNNEWWKRRENNIESPTLKTGKLVMYTRTT